ncbi:hypothetical protein LTR04_001274 [Oleoguttula sp. CCFEE 6159]|nr:hypothetical protein LTR04_001274 [Oleoguttula sp. CCFEE 6159]
MNSRIIVAAALSEKVRKYYETKTHQHHNQPPARVHSSINMSGTSSVGTSQVYEAGDQRTSKDSENQADRFHEGKENSHQANDSKDERTIANKLAREEKREKEGDHETLETKQHKQDATLPARSHGNEPSKGAKIDQELREEEEEILRKKGAFGPKSSN